MHRLALLVTVVLMLVDLFSIPASADFETDRRVCASNDSPPDAAIAACTRRINSGQLEGHALAVSHINRGVEYRHKGDVNHAIADYDEAIRLDPKYAIAFCN